MSRVLVTGASRGIGRAIALELAAKGHEITVHCRKDLDSARETESQILALGAKASIVSFDVSEQAACRELLTKDIAAHGPYWGVVLNAGVHHDAPFPALKPEEWTDVVRTNLDGFYHVLSPLVMPMIQLHSGGRIVTVSSVAALAGNRGQVNYSASKAGLIGATKSLALELAKREITVNCVAPGFIETEMIEGIAAEQITKIVPMRRAGKPSEVASLVGYLFSDGAAYLTGQVISPNGGIY